METEELTRLVDEIYKNILDKFNPGARQLINAGKAYLKALHGAAAASRVYVDALSRLARQAQLGTWGGSKDVGFALMRIVEVYKEIQDQEMNILKAFYVDLLVPLETNLEKDTKVVQSEQKKFLQQHKTRSETYSKAAATMKKQRKKSRAANKSGLAMDKELKNMQILEEEKTKLDAFCEQSLKNAMTQERRRYGFVLERQCSLAKHYASFHEVALAALHPSVDKWREVAATREYLPQSVEDMFASRLRQTSFWPDENEENGGSELTTMSSQLRKTRSMDSSCLELRLGPLPGNPQSSGGHLGPTPHLPAVLSRARSEANLHASTLSLGPEVPETPPRPRSMAPPTSRSSGGGTGIGAGGWGDAPLARALFAYLSSGENQLSFLEGDLIALMGDRQKGWQFGENLRTQSSGWFPLAYTEIIIDDTLGSPSHGASHGRTDLQAIPPCKPPPSRPPITPASIDDSSGGTTGANSNSANSNNANNNNNNNSCVGTPTNNASVLATPTARQSKSIRPSGTLPAVLAGGRRVQPPVPPVPPPAMTSLHSSNDSGFSNEPPVQPDVDYSDDEVLRQRRRKPRSGGDRPSPKDERQAKDWENDSWKTIPRDEKSWQLYRTAMDLWAESKANRTGEDSKKYFEMENGDFGLENGNITKKRKSKKMAQQPNERPSPNQRTKMADERSAPAVTRHGDQRRVDKRTQAETEEDELEEDEEDFGAECNNNNNNNNKFYGKNQESQQERRGGSGFEADKYAKSSSSSSESDDESTITIPEPGRKVEHIAQKLEQTAQKYAREHSPPKFLERRERTNAAEYKSLERETRETPSSRERRERSAVEYKSLERSRDGGQKNSERLRDDKHLRDDERTMRDDKHSHERGSREDKQNFGRLRDDKQSFERSREEKANFERAREDKQCFERSREDKQIFERSREDKQSFDRSREDKRSFQRSREEAQSYERARARSRNDQERAYTEQRKEVMGYERTFEKNRNRMVERLSGRRFERPRPPSQEAPERPVGPYRERRYSDKEEVIYGETGRYGIDSLERDRGYESNFETKLERSKVIERHGYHAGLHGPDAVQKRNIVPRNSEQSNGDTNNNTLKMERKSPRQGHITGMGHLAQTGRAFEEAKSPKLVKRTKSFWKFRRDSEVLEGMALWQHRSLVDIPKMIRKEDKMAGNEEKQRNSEGGSPNSSLGNSESTITNEHRHEEPKPAERSHVPDKMNYFDDFPTPAERPKITERSAYRIQQQPEERAYFVGNVSRKAIIEKERKRSLEAKRNMIVAELKENNESKRNEILMHSRRNYDEEEDATLNFSETEASDEESTYSCIVVKDQSIPEKTLLPRTKLRRESDRDRNTCGPWYDLWGMDASVNKKKRKQKQQ
ncbi:zinc finger CCCH domain-containing protein 13 isoform X2 [Formica exsecta]|uniref:zinc finger CCCH domain-containing protein 13 isoform X2 n=1 Tax=Formica exsecta TaxID=72781 RepID=UPI0011421474|nr:zinc finger CCCH domain-containing protein 13 isoform X2 [Formica exsecta]